MRKARWGVALVGIAVGIGLSSCSGKNAADIAKAEKAAKDAQAAQAEFSAYDIALRAHDKEAMKAHMTPEAASDISRMSDEANAQLADLAFALLEKMRPSDAHIVSCDVSGDSATVRLKGTLEGAAMQGEVSLARVGEGWRVAKEHWSGSLDLSASQAPSLAAMPAAVRQIVDRVASDDPMVGSKAWLELGARYQSAPTFLAEVKPALWDTRPVHFEMVEETFKGGGNSIRYFSVRGEPGKGTPVPAQTVGEALRYHLWQYENVSGSGFTGSFQEWWSSYASRNGLPT